MPLPTLPDADMLALTCLRAASSKPAKAFGTQIPANLLSVLPFAKVARFGGSAVDPRFLDRATFDVQTWGATRKAAFDFAFEIRTAFRDAWLESTVFAGLGHISFFDEVSAPSELRTSDQADGVWRTQATYSLALRPA
jgi:hypothetical protein